MSIVSIPSDPTPGAAPSPWALNGNDLYPDSTSYIVGIGTDNPDTLLHLKAADGTPKIKLEGTGHSFLIQVDANHAGSSDSNRVSFLSDGTDAGVIYEFKSGSSDAGSNTQLNVAGKANATINFYDDNQGANGKAKGTIISSFDNSRLYFYGEDGYGGGMFTMDWLPTSNTRFAFGYGDQALSNAARLAVKHTSDPQLLLDDGTQTASIQVSNEALTFGHSDTSYNFTVNATTNANLAFAKGGTNKANIRHYGSLEDGLFGPQLGLWKWLATASTATAQNPTASTGFGNVLMLDPGNQSAAQTVNLPAIANYAGGFFKLIDSTGTSASYNITVKPQTGEKLNGVTNGTFVLDQAYQQAICYATSTGWFIESNSKLDVPLRLDTDSNHITFFDRDHDPSAANDVGSVLSYSEPATNQSILKYNMNGSSYDENFVQFEMGASPGIALKRQEGTNVDAFFRVASGEDVLRIGTGTGSATKIFTGNNAVAEFTSSGKLILTEDTTGGATQLELKNGAGDTASFAQNSTNQSLDVTTTDFDVKLYSTNASGNVSFAKADGTRVVKYTNAKARFIISAGLALDTTAISAASTTIADTDARIVYLCDSSSNAMTINLPAASDSTGRVLVIKDKGGQANANNITIDPNSTEKVDGAATIAVNVNYGSAMIICDGSNWFTIN